jgi:hypothetical protein
MALTDNLISVWEADEASGNLLDAHGSNDLTESGTIGSTTGKINGARVLEKASSERFSRADNADLSLGSDSAFHVSIWVRFNSITITDVLVNKGNITGSGDEYLLWIGENGGSQFEFYVGNGISQQNVFIPRATITPATGVWYFMEAWHDPVANQIGIAVNRNEATASWSGGTQDTANAFSIGSSSAGGLYLDADLDQCAFWKDRHLSSAESNQLYNSGNGLAYVNWAAPATNRRRRLICGAAA